MQSTQDFLVERNFAVIVKAKDLGQEHVGRGILQELWRDHTFYFISRIGKTDDGKIELEHIEIVSTTKNKNTRNQEVEITEHRVKKVVRTFEPEADICLDVNAHTRPTSRRITKTTTVEVTNENLDDDGNVVS